MEPKLIVELLESVVGKNTGQIKLVTDNHGRALSWPYDPLAKVELRPDGLIRTQTTDGGWDVFDPADVRGLTWTEVGADDARDGKPGAQGGQYL